MSKPDEQYIQFTRLALCTSNGPPIVELNTMAGHTIKLHFYLLKEGVEHGVTLRLRPMMPVEELARQLDHPITWTNPGMQTTRPSTFARPTRPRAPELEI